MEVGRTRGWEGTRDLGWCWGRMEQGLGRHWGQQPQRGNQDGSHAGLTFRVQQTCQPQVLLSRAEGSLQVVVGVGLGELAEVHEIGPRQGHRVGRQEAGSRASEQTGKSHPCVSPAQGEGGRGMAPAGKAVCAGTCLRSTSGGRELCRCEDTCLSDFRVYRSA